MTHNHSSICVAPVALMLDIDVQALKEGGGGRGRID